MLARAPAEDHHGRAGKLPGVLHEGLAVGVEGGVSKGGGGQLRNGDGVGGGDELGRAAVGRRLGGGQGDLAGVEVVVVDVQKVAVEFKVLTLQRVLQTDAAGHVGRGGAAAVIDHLNGADAEKVDFGLLRPAGEGEQAVVVLHEDEALLRDLADGVAGGGVAHLLLGGVGGEFGQEPVPGAGEDKAVDEDGGNH